jgi:hypothetical protein
MSGWLRYALRRLPRRTLGLALSALVLAPAAASAAQLDTVTATGTASRFYSNIDINAQSSPTGQNPSGTVSFTFANAIVFSGPVTSLSVTGADSGGGTPTSPTVAVIGVQTAQFGPEMIRLVDNGGNGLDSICMWLPPNPVCTVNISGEFLDVTGQLTSGRAVVFDAPVVPTSKAQCQHGGWRNFAQFKNRRQCVAFVAKQARMSCLAERTTIGRAAFRIKYGKGRYHRYALRRCIKQAESGR